MPGKALRIALFTHDTFGLGHVRRCVRIMRSLAEQDPACALLLVTGSPAMHLVADLPPNADYIKVPTTVKTGTRGNQPPHLPLPAAERTTFRANLIGEAVLGFAPDVFVVDNFPLGSQGELLPALRALRATRTRTLLGLRDVLDAPEVVQADWSRQGIYDVLERYYDRILVYGVPEILDVTREYQLSDAVSRKVRYCGYVTDNELRTHTAAKPGNGRPPFLLATGGGGGDAYPLLKLFLEALPQVPPSSAVVVTGPMMGSGDRSQLHALAAPHPDVELLDYTSDLPGYFARADVVVSMCGYNSAAEIAALGARAIVVPRTWKYGEHLNRERTAAEWEQLLRARALAQLGIVQMLEPEHATPAILAETITRVLAEQPARPSVTLNLDGAATAAAEILELAKL